MPRLLNWLDLLWNRLSSQPSPMPFDFLMPAVSLSTGKLYQLSRKPVDSVNSGVKRPAHISLPACFVLLPLSIGCLDLGVSVFSI